jgi:hypothetical protein
LYLKLRIAPSQTTRICQADWETLYAALGCRSSRSPGLQAVFWFAASYPSYAAQQACRLISERSPPFIAPPIAARNGPSSRAKAFTQ